MAGVSTLSEVLNTQFTETWYEIQAEAADNILDATPITALLKMKGSFKTQRGSDTITRTIRYGEKETFAFKRGSVLPVTENELTTQARWPWAYWGVPITRTFIDDQQNSGPTQIKDYLERRMQAAREALIQKLESIFMVQTIHAGGDEPLSIFDAVPDNETTDFFTSGKTFGGITRDNTWWQHIDFTDDVTVDLDTAPNKHDIKAGPAALTMFTDMVNAYNWIGAQREYPDIILTSQSLFELYEDFAVAKDQLIKDDTTRLADLGYDVLRFKGNPITWSSFMEADTVGKKSLIFLNSSWFDVVYDPGTWFEMSSWERPERQLEQVAYIVSAMQNICHQLRTNGRIRWSSL